MWFWSVSWWTNCPVFFSFFLVAQKNNCPVSGNFWSVSENFWSTKFLSGIPKFFLIDQILFLVNQKFPETDQKFPETGQSFFGRPKKKRKRPDNWSTKRLTKTTWTGLNRPDNWSSKGLTNCPVFFSFFWLTKKKIV